MKQHYLLLFLAGILLYGCSSETDGVSDGEPIADNPTSVPLYFPPNQSPDWETVSPSALGWDTNNQQVLMDFLEENGTRAFIILKEGRLVTEWYFGEHDQNTRWYWASAGKTLTAFTVGLAQEQGFLNITDKTSDYLGLGWTSSEEQIENNITVGDQLRMTTGLDDTLGDCKSPDCLNFVADAGTRWAYHNGPYTLLQDVVASATNSDWDGFFDQNLKNAIGMDGFWLSANELNNVYFSTARSMARFGLLNLNRGIWNGAPILNDSDYFDQMTTTSQDLNLSYGYLWWLNGKTSYRLPQSQVQFNGPLVPNGPTDMFSGLGRDDQKLYIVPSENLVIVRMGEAAGESLLAASSFDNALWGQLNAFMNR